MQFQAQNGELIIALFKEYLMLNDFSETLRVFKEELLLKGTQQTITKRSQMVDALDLKQQALNEQAKKNQGLEYMKSTLEILINDYLTVKIAPKEQAAAPPQNQLKTFAAEKIEVKKKIVKKVIRPGSATQLPQARLVQKSPDSRQKESSASQLESIWSGTSVTNKQSTLPVIKSGENNEIMLLNFIEQTATLNDFYMVLFHDKRVKAIPDNWYQGLYNMKPSSPIDLQDYQTWGIHQDKGGPCGFISVIQARAIKYIFFGEKPQIHAQNVYRSAVLQALCDTFSQLNAGTYYFALPKSFYSSRIMCEYIIQDMSNFMVVPVTNLSDFLQSDSFQQFCFTREVCSFIPSMVVSLVLSRGIQAILSDDFDPQGGSSLFSNCNNASQELVNLMLTGRATAGLHDGDQDVGGMQLRGVYKPCDVGMVTIFEYFEYLQVGTYLRQDVQFPIFVSFNEAHYTVLFSLNRRFSEIREQERGSVEMIYIDQLGDQNDMYALAVQFDSELYSKKESESFVENLLQTLLPVTSVDWKGKDKLL